MEKVAPTRIHTIKHAKIKKGPVIYKINRDQRVKDNWALIYAQELAQQNNQTLIVIFGLSPFYSNITLRHYDFMIKGLQEVEKKLKEKNIPFYILKDTSHKPFLEFLNKVNASALITDFNPLKTSQNWNSKIKDSLDIPFYEVDAHNICPCRQTSPKQEFAARTIRPKIHKLLIEYLTEFPELETQHQELSQPKNDWEGFHKYLNIDTSVKPINWLKPGEDAAQEVLNNFIINKLNTFDEKRNDPTLDGTSNISPYLHFGQISAQRIVLEVLKSKAKQSSKDSYIEELVVRRELSDNYCFYNPNYDNFNGFPDWAKKTLNEHKNDTREFLYSKSELENAQTHDDLWNAAQMEMVKKGKMHGYMRMYWCKKILEWTKSPEEAQEITLYLNDKYEIDGNDPNGYVGVAWSIGGVHDRAWSERNVFGKIRFMSYNGCKSKFKIDEYIKMVDKIN